MLAVQPVWVNVARAGDVIPGMEKNMLLHAGPPEKYENMCGPQRGAAWEALIFEGMAKEAKEADRPENLLSKAHLRKSKEVGTVLILVLCSNLIFTSSSANLFAKGEEKSL